MQASDVRSADTVVCTDGDSKVHTIKDAPRSARNDNNDTSIRTMIFNHRFQFNGSIGSDDGWGTNGSP